MYEHAVEQLKRHRSFADLRRMDGHYATFEATKPGRKKKASSSERRSAHSASSNNSTELTVSEWNAELQRLRKLFDEDEAAIVGDNLPFKRLSGLQEDSERFHVSAIVEKTNQRIRTAAVEWRKHSFEDWWKTARQDFATNVSAPLGSYKLPEISQASSCSDDTWKGMEVLPDAGATTPQQMPGHLPVCRTPPSRRNFHIALWADTRMIIWSGFPAGAYGW